MLKTANQIADAVLRKLSNETAGATATAPTPAPAGAKPVNPMAGVAKSTLPSVPRTAPSVAPLGGGPAPSAMKNLAILGQTTGTDGRPGV
jgi:hypothetical protein